MTVIMSNKGQLVIPAKVRKRYHMTPGSRIEVLDTGQQIVLVPVPKDAFRTSGGMLKGKMTVQDLLNERRKEREREQRHHE